MSLLTVGLILWCWPRFPISLVNSLGNAACLRGVLKLPGIRPVLGIVLSFVLAHNILYTYTVPFLAGAGMS